MRPSKRPPGYHLRGPPTLCCRYLGCNDTEEATIEDMWQFESTCGRLDLSALEATRPEDKARILRAVSFYILSGGLKMLVCELGSSRWMAY